MDIKRIDCRGDVCPIPVVKANQAIAEMKSGLLQVQVDNETALNNLKRLADTKKFAFQHTSLGENDFLVEITVSENECAECEEILGDDDYLICIDANTMGRGDEALGKILLKGFIFAVTQLEHLPSKMLFYNSGAYITAEGSDSLEDLKALAAQGVTIETCGTCINHYKLSNPPAVGEVTNMYNIVSALTSAKKVIKP